MADSRPSRLAVGDARRATVGDSIQISNLLNILMDLNTSVSLQRTFCVLAILIKETYNILGIVPPQRTFCVPRTYIKRPYRALEIVSLQRTFCVLEMYMKDPYKRSDIVSSQRTFSVLGIYMKEAYRTLEIVLPQRTFCVLGFKNNKFIENSRSSHLNVRFVF